jgi:hypothetical protein
VVSVIPELGWSDHVSQLRLLVDPAHRSQGVGREFARAALVQALELGLSKIIVEVVADQQPAINMFTALGFDPEALLHSQFRDRTGDFHDLIILAHRVDENRQAFGRLGSITVEQSSGTMDESATLVSAGELAATLVSDATGVRAQASCT